ncbi:MAG: hypothetical protein PHZ23_15490 [Acidiphilium sp.]|nr:hypothetical protein [Acidiphilium sp.]
MASTANDDGPETARIIRNGARLVALSKRSQLVAEWTVWASLALAAVGFCLVIRAHG